MDSAASAGANRAARKAARKAARARHAVEAGSGLGASHQPTRFIAVCNAGLSNGLSEESVLKAFSQYGLIDKVIMLPNRSYCFLSFQTTTSAIEAHDSINGKLNIAQDNKPLYLAYMREIPEAAPTAVSLPSGLKIFEDFINEEEERLLLSLMDWSTVPDANLLKHRQVQHFGYAFFYGINNVHKDEPFSEPIPPECSFMEDRWRRLDVDLVPDQLTVNKYEPGQGIPSHIDTHSAFEDTILSISLGSSVLMEFRKDSSVHVPVLLPRRSLLVMSGEARYAWAHGITPRKYDTLPSSTGLTSIQRKTRVAFTFRKVLRGQCCCSYRKYCDSQKETELDQLIHDEIAAKLESSHVHHVYDEIASHFSDTRHKPWPNVVQFLQSFEPGSMLLDVGCGNGKYMGPEYGMLQFGCDHSVPLLQVCRQKGLETFCCNCLSIPCRDDLADGAISIAVIHHLATEERRLRAVQELIRAVRVGGRVLIYVWAKDQQRNSQKSSYLKQDSNATRADITEETFSFQNQTCLPVHVNRTQFQHRDVMVPWKLKGKHRKSDSDPTFLRYYHVFEEGELERLSAKATASKIVRSYYDQGNWCVILEKC